MSFSSRNPINVEPLIILLLNAFVVFLFFYVQSVYGMGPGEVHIDEKTYLELGKNYAESGIGLCSVGQQYYCLVTYLKGDVDLIIIINLIIYFVTSLILINKLLPFSKENFFHFLLFLILIFDPYRIHLALHVLKETIIIFSLLLFFCNSKFLRLIGFIIGISFRIAMPIYFFLDVKLNLRLIFLSFVIFLMAFFLLKDTIYGDVIYFMISGSQKDMVFQGYDKIPTFNEYGFGGDILRAIVWPVIVIFGVFIIISPSFYFFPIFFSLLIYNLYSFICLKKFPFLKGFFISASILAFVVPGFTTYFRYIYPMIIVLPIIQVRNKKLNE